MYFSQFDEQAIAQAELSLLLYKQSEAVAPEKRDIKTPQRKAKLHDKQRTRLKDVKEWALRRAGCSDTKEIKKYLKKLGRKLDLRLTSAWIAVNKEFADSIKRIKLAETFSVGKVVNLREYSARTVHVEVLSPFVITAIVGEKAQLDMFRHLVSLEDLIVVA